MLAAALAVLAVTGCFKDWSDPRVVLTRFLEAWYEQDLEEVYEHLCAADRAHRSLEKYIALDGTEDSIVVGPLLERSTFEIESLEMEAFRARARVHVREPDMSLVMGDMMNEAFRAIGSGASPADFDRALERRYAHKKIPMKTRRKVYSLVQEEGRWKVDLHWPVEMELANLVLRAARSEERGDLEGARKDYRAALSLDDSQIELEKHIERLSTAMLPRAEQTRRSQAAMDAYLAEIRARSGR